MPTPAYIQSLMDHVEAGPYSPQQKKFYLDLISDTLQSSPEQFLRDIAAKIDADQSTAERQSYRSREAKFISSALAKFEAMIKEWNAERQTMTNEQKLLVADAVIQQRGWTSMPLKSWPKDLV